MEAKQLLSQSRSQLSTLKRPPPPHAVQLEKITLALKYYFTLIISECFELVGHFCFCPVSMIVFLVLISIFEIAKSQGQNQDGTTRPFPSEQR